MTNEPPLEPTCADELNGHWPKIAAILLAKLGRDVRIDLADLQVLAGHSIVVGHEQEGRVARLRLLPDAEAKRLGDAYQQAARRRQ